MKDLLDVDVGRVKGQGASELAEEGACTATCCQSEVAGELCSQPMVRSELPQCVVITNEIDFLYCLFAALFEN